MILRLIPAAALGVLLGGVLGALFTGDWIYTIVWALAIPVVILSSMALGVRRMGIRAKRAEVVDTRIFALARVENVRRTGRDSGEAPEVDLRVTIAPDDREPYRTTIRQSIDAATLAGVQAGRIVVVQRLAADRPEAVLALDAPEGWRARAEAAMRDRSLFPAAIAPDWEDPAEDGVAAAPAAPAARKPLRPGALVPILAALVAAGVTLIPAWPMVSRTVANVATGNWDGNSMLTGDHQQEAVDAIAAVAGHYDFTGVSFYDEYVIVEGLTSPGADTTDDFHWRYGRAWQEGPSLIQPDLETELFDADDIDFSQVARLVEQAKDETGFTEFDGVYASVSRFTPDGAVAVHVSVSDPYKDAFFVYGLDGEEISRSGTAFE